MIELRQIKGLKLEKIVGLKQKASIELLNNKYTK